MIDEQAATYIIDLTMVHLDANQWSLNGSKAKDREREKKKRKKFLFTRQFYDIDLFKGLLLAEPMRFKSLLSWLMGNRYCEINNNSQKLQGIGYDPIIRVYIYAHTKVITIDYYTVADFEFDFCNSFVKRVETMSNFASSKS